MKTPYDDMVQIVKILARNSYLEGIDFLDKRGRRGAGGSRAKKVQITFVTGETFIFTLEQFERDLGDTDFKLCPVLEGQQ